MDALETFRGIRENQIEDITFGLSINWNRFLLKTASQKRSEQPEVAEKDGQSISDI